MSMYEVRFNLPAEIVVRLEAPDEDTAADEAWERANEHTQSSAMDSHSLGASVYINLDGTGADQVTEGRPMTAHDGARADVRKRHEAAQAAEVDSGATNSPETGNRTSGPENGAVGIPLHYVAAMVADARGHADRPHPFCPQCVTNIEALAAELDRLTAALAAERSRVAAGLALADECANSPCTHLNDLWGRLRAALTTTATEGGRTDD